jgi:hypothetical protein
LLTYQSPAKAGSYDATFADVKARNFQNKADHASVSLAKADGASATIFRNKANQSSDDAGFSFMDGPRSRPRAVQGRSRRK